jgi:2-dehydropantoate 2-reductase
MKTLIYGAGPIGRVYAYFLQQAGKDVTLLAREMTYRSISENGIVLRDGYTDEIETVKLKTIERLNPTDEFDIVMVAMSKSSRLAVCPVLAENPNLKHLIFVGNDISGFKKYTDLLPPEKILLGFPSAGGGIEDNVLIYVDRDKEKGKRDPLYLGELERPPGERTRRLKAFFESADIPVKLVDDMDGWLKYHVAFVAPVAGVYFKCGRDIKAIQRDEDAIRIYIRACREAGNVLRAAGYRKRQPFIFNLYYWVPEGLNVKIFRDKFFGSRFVEVAMGMHAQAIGDELKDLVQEFKDLQAETSVETPHLDHLLSFIPGN